MYRTSLSVDDETVALIQKAANAQNRTLAGQMRHLLKSHPEVVGWKIFRNHPEFNKQLVKPVGLEK